MKQVIIYSYYSFGYNYSNLMRGNNSQQTNQSYFKEVSNYNEFIKNLDLRVTMSSAELKGFPESFEKLEVLANDAAQANKIISPILLKEISSKIEAIDSTLDAELNLKIAHILEEKRYSNEILLEKMSNLFSKNTFSSLPTIAQTDFDESGKCLAFDRYTACAFHALRGTEDVLKMYYEKTLKISATDKDTWGTFETAIINAISSKTISPEPEEQLVINIGSLRRFYRNKTQHPQNTYSSDEAQDLLSLCIKTVNELIADLRSRKLI